MEDEIVTLVRDNIRGRGLGRPYGTVARNDDGSFTVRVDDEERAEFWLEIRLTPDQVDALSASESKRAREAEFRRQESLRSDE